MKKELLILLFIIPLVFFYVFSHSMKYVKQNSIPEVRMEDSFEVLQGCGTDDWSYVQTKCDYDDLDSNQVSQESFNGGGPLSPNENDISAGAGGIGF